MFGAESHPHSYPILWNYIILQIYWDRIGNGVFYIEGADSVVAIIPRCSGNFENENQFSFNFCECAFQIQVSLCLRLWQNRICPESKVLPEGSTSPVQWKSPLLGPWSSVVLSPAPPSHQTTRQTNYTPMDPIVHTVKQEHFQSGLNQHLPPRTNWCLQVKEKSCKGSNSCRWQNVTEPARQGKQDIQANQIPQKEDT